MGERVHGQAGSGRGVTAETCQVGADSWSRRSSDTTTARGAGELTPAAANTIACMAGASAGKIEAAHMAEAIQYRPARMGIGVGG